MADHGAALGWLPGLPSSLPLEFAPSLPQPAQSPAGQLGDITSHHLV